MTDASVQLFIGLLNKKQAVLVNSSKALFLELANEDLEKKRHAARKTLAAAQDIHVLIAHYDTPSWLVDLMQCLHLYTESGWGSQPFLESFIKVKDALINHKWVYKENTVEAFDFEAIFERHRKESRLPELFDQIIKILEELHASDAVDSNIMLRSLGKVIATMKKGKEGSYFSFATAWDFLLAFLSNFIWGELSSLPVLGSAFEALKKTIDEANEEVSKVYSSVQRELETVVGSELRAMDKINFSSLSYNKDGRVNFEGNVRRISYEA